MANVSKKGKGVKQLLQRGFIDLILKLFLLEDATNEDITT